VTEGHIRVGIISTDVRFRDRLREALSESGRGFRIALELSVRFADFGEDQVQALRHAAPDLLIVDLEDDPEVGVKLVQFLAESHPTHRVLAAGPTLSPGLLLAAMRAGVSDYVQKPVEPDALHESLQRVAALLGRAGDSSRKPGQVFSVFGAKGGTGSTTLATNLAIVLHRLTSKRTLLVDLDLELGEVAVQLGVRPRFNLVDMIQNFHRMDAGLLASFIEQHPSGVHLLSAPFHPERAEATSAEEIRKILGFLKQHYDYVVVDTSKSFSPTTLAAFDQSDSVLVVVALDLPSLRNVQRGLPLLKRVLPRGLEQARLIVNRYQPDEEIGLKEVEQTLGLKVFWTLSNDYEAVIRSINQGKPIVLNGSSKYTKDVKGLGAKIAGLGAKDRVSRPSASQIVGQLVGKIVRKTGDKEG
jgi:pilus assembly protein CpaE